MLKLGVPKNANIIADSAEPKSIEELKRKGWKVQNAYKGPDSIQSGISKIKQFEVYVDQDSENLLNEYALYCWKAGSDKPIDSHNHAIDAVRYALSKENIGQYAFTRKGVNKFMPD
jgi:phage terminase large subunit